MGVTTMPDRDELKKALIDALDYQDITLYGPDDLPINKDHEEVARSELKRIVAELVGTIIDALPESALESKERFSDAAVDMIGKLSSAESTPRRFAFSFNATTGVLDLKFKTGTRGEVKAAIPLYLMAGAAWAWWYLTRKKGISDALAPPRTSRGSGIDFLWVPDGFWVSQRPVTEFQFLLNIMASIKVDYALAQTGSRGWSAQLGAWYETEYANLIASIRRKERQPPETASPPYRMVHTVDDRKWAGLTIPTVAEWLRAKEVRPDLIYPCEVEWVRRPITFSADLGRVHCESGMLLENPVAKDERHCFRCVSRSKP